MNQLSAEALSERYLAYAESLLPQVIAAHPDFSDEQIKQTLDDAVMAAVENDALAVVDQGSPEEDAIIAELEAFEPTHPDAEHIAAARVALEQV